jgi:N-acetylneuraminate synthase
VKKKVRLVPVDEILGRFMTSYVIAEIGSNWNTLDDCLFSIAAVKRAGASAVKFQLYTHKEMYGVGGTMPGELPRDWVPKMAAEAQEVGIDFLCSAFSADGVKFLDPYVKYHKVASSEISDLSILAAIMETGKRPILSTGSAQMHEIQVACSYFSNPILLYCCAEYPARHVDLRWVRHLESLFRCECGFSDHTDHIFGLALEALRQGVPYYEKHVTCFPDLDTPDAKHSITDLELRHLLNAPSCSYLDNDKWANWEMFAMHKRRYIATRDLKPGDALIRGENYGVYRSTVNAKYVSPSVFEIPTDAKATRKIKAGEAILPGDVNGTF